MNNECLIVLENLFAKIRLNIEISIRLDANIHSDNR